MMQVGEPHFAVHTADKSCNFTANGTAFKASVAAKGVKVTVKAHAAGMPCGPHDEIPEGFTASAGPFLCRLLSLSVKHYGQCMLV